MVDDLRVNEGLRSCGGQRRGRKRLQGFFDSNEHTRCIDVEIRLESAQFDVEGILLCCV
jgi:hypothetical protein